MFRRPSSMVAALLAVALAVVSVSTGCIGTFGAAKSEGIKVSLGAALTPEHQARCDRIDTLQVVFGGATLVLAAAASGTGLTAWRVRDDGTKDALTITAGIAGLLAVGTGYVWDQKSKQWVREGCQ